MTSKNIVRTSQSWKFEHSKTAFRTIWPSIAVSSHVETEPDTIFLLQRVAAWSSGWQLVLDKSSNDSQTGQRHSTDQVQRHQQIAVHLADVFEEGQVITRPEISRVEMHDLQICRHRRAVFVHVSIEWKPVLRPTCKSIVKAMVRSLTIYRQTLILLITCNLDHNIVANWPAASYHTVRLINKQNKLP